MGTPMPPSYDESESHQQSGSQQARPTDQQARQTYLQAQIAAQSANPAAQAQSAAYFAAQSQSANQATQPTMYQQGPSPYQQVYSRSMQNQAAAAQSSALVQPGYTGAPTYTQLQAQNQQGYSFDPSYLPGAPSYTQWQSQQVNRYQQRYANQLLANQGRVASSYGNSPQPSQYVYPPLHPELFEDEHPDQPRYHHRPGQSYPSPAYPGVSQRAPGAQTQLSNGGTYRRVGYQWASQQATGMQSPTGQSYPSSANQGVSQQASGIQSPTGQSYPSSAYPGLSQQATGAQAQASQEGNYPRIEYQETQPVGEHLQVQSSQEQNQNQQPSQGRPQGTAARMRLSQQQEGASQQGVYGRGAPAENGSSGDTGRGGY